MEEGLRTGSLCSTVKHELDLNRDPFDQMEPALTLCDSVSKKDKKDLDLNEFVKSECEAVGEVTEGVKDRKGEDNENNRVSCNMELENEGLDEKERDENEKHQISCNVELEDEGLSLKSSGLGEIECGENEKNRISCHVEVENEGLLLKSSGLEEKERDENEKVTGVVNNVGKVKGRRGRKKKVVKDSRAGDVVSLDGDLLEKNDSTSLQVDKMNVEEETTPKKRGRPRKETKGDAIKIKDSKCRDDGDVKMRKKRGRKRKKNKDVDCSDDEVMKRRKVDATVFPGPLKRVLRSRDSKKNVCGAKDARLSDKKTENNADVRSDDKRSLKKKLKGRRGRPLKTEGKAEVSRMTSSEKDKLRGPKRSLDHETADGSVRDSKYPKKNQIKGGEEVDNAGKGMTTGCDKGSDRENSESPQDGGNKRLDDDPNPKKKSTFQKSKQKQAVRDQIVSMILKAGWTIEYRPRQSKLYNDAVYVDPQGRQHWSCTKAYRRLKESVDAGDADDMSLAAFVPIPEEVFSTLFRITTGKRRQKKDGDDGSKIRKKTAKKKLSNKQSAKGIVSPKMGHSSSVAARRKKLGSNAGGQGRKPCALLARNSKAGVDSDGEECIIYDGKRTILAWMIDLGVIESNAPVHYIFGERKKVKHGGKITRDGILCFCCDKTVKLAEFESHAGSNLNKPFENVYLQSGQSLLQCLVDSWNKQKEADHIGFHSLEIVGDDPNDDTCNICGDGGDLICCDSCPSTFHQSCLDIQKLPSGDWRCVYCSCKFCGTVISKSSENEADDGMIVSELLTCHFCEGKFHLPCVPGGSGLDCDSKDVQFCGKGCQKIFEGLQVLIGVRNDMDDGFCWTLLRRRDFGSDNDLTNNTLDIEINCKLAVAFSVMDECFVPIVDQRSKINIIQSAVYSCGSNFKRLSHHGFYSVILEKGDELVAAASIRIHGTQAVEMPFIGTRYIYRRQGMCRRLLTAIETALCSLGVEKLVIPAIPELVETWTKVFGFSPLEKSERREMISMSMIVFPGTDMLQKPLLKDQFSECHVTSAGSVADAFSEVKLNQEDKGASLHVESGVDVSDGFLNDKSDCRNNSTIRASELDVHETEKIANCLSSEPECVNPSDVIHEHQQIVTSQHHVSEMENKALICSLASPKSMDLEEKTTNRVKTSKEASFLSDREGECLNDEPNSLDKDFQETSPIHWQNACHALEVPAEKDSIASSEMTSDLMSDSPRSVKATSEASHQIESAVGCLDLPVNGYICVKTSISDSSSLNCPLVSQEACHDIMGCNINDHKEVSMDVHVSSIDSKCLQNGVELSAKSSVELESCSSE